jgi:hypothetical protein
MRTSSSGTLRSKFSLRNAKETGKEPSEVDDSPKKEKGTSSRFRRSGSLSQAADRVESRDTALDTTFAAIRPHCQRSLKLEDLTTDQKRKLVEDFELVQSLSPEDYVKVLSKYKPRPAPPTEQLGLFGGIAERKVGWQLVVAMHIAFVSTQSFAFRWSGRKHL